LAEFFASQGMDQLMRDMKLRLMGDSDCVLGSGRLGSVFRVCADDGRGAQACMALKVVFGSDNARRLENEFNMNQEICQCRPGVIVKAVAFSKRYDVHERDMMAGMLMDEVGSEVSATQKGGLLSALHALTELHQTGYWHGSARRDNMLTCGDRLKWCDVQRAGCDEQAAHQSHRYWKHAMFEADLEALLRSFGYYPSTTHIPKSLPTADNKRLRTERMLDAYVAHPTLEGLLAHADQLRYALELDGEGQADDSRSDSRLGPL
jgi:hypothetical protein